MSLTNAEKQAAFTKRKKQEGLRQFKIWLSEETAQAAENCYSGQKRLDALAQAIVDGIHHHTTQSVSPVHNESIANIKTCVEKWRNQITEQRQKAPITNDSSL